MGKHGKNATANPVYSYHERQKDKAKGGYGTQAARLGADSQREVDCCCLTLQPVVEGVVTPDGYLYEKKAILENLLHQKQEIARQLKEYTKQKTRLEREKKEMLEARRADEIEKFARQEGGIVSKVDEHFSEEKKIGHAALAYQQSKKEAMQTAKGKVTKDITSFWVPSFTPEAKETKLKKPKSKTVCPMSGNPLKFKDLIPVKFEPVDPSSTQSLVAREERYMCPVTRTVFKGNVEAAVLKLTGRVVTMECVRQIVRPEMKDPISGEPLKEEDIIPLQRGASGFAGSGSQLTAKVYTPAQLVA